MTNRMTSKPVRALRNKSAPGVSLSPAHQDHVHSSIGVMQLLFTLNAANMNVTTDQPFTKAWAFNEYEIATIRCRDADGTLSTAAGGIYTAAAKGGTALVAAGQAYSGITGTGQGIDLTIAAAGRAKQTATPIFALTTAQGAARVATLEIWGIPLSE